MSEARGIRCDDLSSDNDPSLDNDPWIANNRKIDLASEPR